MYGRSGNTHCKATVCCQSALTGGYHGIDVSVDTFTAATAVASMNPDLLFELISLREFRIWFLLTFNCFEYSLVCSLTCTLRETKCN